jgi:hypothetical protein
MENSVKITLIIVSSVLVLALIGIYAFIQMGDYGNTVSANGQAVIDAVPDMVSVYFSIQTNGSSAGEAKDRNAEIADEVVTELVKLGLERKQIVTENFNVYPEYSWKEGKQELEGYKATHSIVVEMSSDELDDVGEVVDAGVDSGALISYINFELSHKLQNQYKTEALKIAAEDAKLKAESTALGLDRKLGSLVSVSSQSFEYYPWPIYRAEMDLGAGMNAEQAKVAATNIQPGEQEIRASVSVVYKLR